MFFLLVPYKLLLCESRFAFEVSVSSSNLLNELLALLLFPHFHYALSFQVLTLFRQVSGVAVVFSGLDVAQHFGNHTF